MADVSTPLPAYTAMLPYWEQVDALKGGTKAMRKAGEAYLPRWPKEEKDDYAVRLASAVLYPAFAQTVENMVGRVFMKPIVLNDSTPEELREQAKDLDLQGNNLDVVAARWFDQALSYGMSHLLVDFPRLEGEVRTLADEKASGARPYCTVINPKQVIGWRSTAVGGVQRLTQVRIAETVEEEDGEFGTREVEQVRVLDPGAYRLYRRGKDGQGWVLHSQGPMSLPVIPLVTLYTGRTGFMTARPPLVDLAELNVKHWQQQSEQDTNLHVARNPILFLRGIDAENIKWGSRYAMSTTDQNADGKFIEHSGTAISAGRLALEDLKDEMRESGARMLRKASTAAKTATESRDDAVSEQSQLGRMAKALEDAIDQALQLMAAWQGIEKDAGAVSVNDDFGSDPISDASVAALVQMNANGKLSDQTLFEELQRRGILADSLQWEDEQERIQSGGDSEMRGILDRLSAEAARQGPAEVA